MYPITIVIPVKDPPNLEEFIQQNSEVFQQCTLVVIDSGGGEALQHLASEYIKKKMPFWEARKLGYIYVNTPFILNLDADVVIPSGYINDALALLSMKADAVSIFYEDISHCQGALEYGISLWKTKILRELYNYSRKQSCNGKIVQVGPHTYSTLNSGFCECTYMFRRLKNKGYRLETLSCRAKHLR